MGKPIFSPEKSLDVFEVRSSEMEAPFVDDKVGKETAQMDHIKCEELSISLEQNDEVVERYPKDISKDKKLKEKKKVLTPSSERKKEKALLIETKEVLGSTLESSGKNTNLVVAKGKFELARGIE